VSIQTIIFLTCWVLDSPAIGYQCRLSVRSIFPDSCVYSFHGRKSPDISLFKKKKNASSQTRIAGASQQERGRALANDDSTRFGTATKARASEEVDDVEADVEENL
jgi:hypothetical protein